MKAQPTVNRIGQFSSSKSRSVAGFKTILSSGKQISIKRHPDLHKSNQTNMELNKSNFKSIHGSNHSLHTLEKIQQNSLEVELEKLELITTKNLTARYNWLSIEQKIIQLNIRRKLKPLSGDLKACMVPNQPLGCPKNPIELLKKYQSTIKLGERLKSFDFTSSGTGSLSVISEN